MKIILNKCYGGPSLSTTAMQELGLSVHGELDCPRLALDDKSTRTNPKYTEIVERLGPKASGYSSRLVVVEIPDDSEWTIYDYDGVETLIHIDPPDVEEVIKGNINHTKSVMSDFIHSSNKYHEHISMNSMDSMLEELEKELLDITEKEFKPKLKFK